MKRLLLATVMLLAGTAFADPQAVNRSSFTQTNESGYIPAMFLDKVIVGATSASGSLTLYNSTYTTSGMISSVTLGTLHDHIDFNDLQVKGIYYVTNGNSAGVTILYKK